MPDLPTVVLRHTTPDGGHHFDWMIADPAEADQPDGRLWTARVALPSCQWREAGEFDLTVLPLHRRAYLTYQGPVSGDRGRVHRVDQGYAAVRQWTDRRITLDLTLRRFTGRIKLNASDGPIWRAYVVAKP